MKIVFSRKGFDSAAGGMPSPLLAGRPCSLPIPANGTPTGCRYADLVDPLPDIVRDLGRGMDEHTPCHLDPDIDAGLVRASRGPGWRGSLGQVGAAQSHLANQGVGHGDVFVFWGLFRAVQRSAAGWRFEGRPEHRIFGWLQIGEILPVGSDLKAIRERRPWLEAHPHLRSGWASNNTIYVAADRLRLDGSDSGLPGFGRLPRGRRLSACQDGLLSTWRVPAWLDASRGGTGMTYHPPARWLGNGLLRAAPRGQEFVARAGVRRDALDWLGALVDAGNAGP